MSGLYPKLFRDHIAFTLRTLRRLGVPPADLEDAAQEVFVVVHRRIDSLVNVERARSWVFGIARRVASDHRKRHRRRREELRAEPVVVEIEPKQEASLDRARLRQQLDDALAHLHDDKRVVFVLFELEELSMKEVADMVGCPLQTAYSRLYSARSKLRVLLAVDRDEPASETAS